MVLPRWLGVEASSRKSLKSRLVKLVAVPDAPSTGDYGCNPVIAMGVRCDLRMRRHAKHDGVHACLVRIALEYHSLNPDRKSTRLNSSHQIISYAVFCLK